MDAGELWIAALTLVGMVLVLVGLGATWIKLSRIWTERWPAAEPQPLPTRLARWARRTWNALIRRATRHGRLEADAPAVAVGSGGISVMWGGSASGSSSMETRVELLEKRVRDLENAYREDLKRLRDEVEGAVSEVTNEARAQWARNDADARTQLRVALGWPALLILVGTLMQAAAALIAVIRAFN